MLEVHMTEILAVSRQHNRRGFPVNLKDNRDNVADLVMRTKEDVLDVHCVQGQRAVFLSFDVTFSKDQNISHRGMIQV